MSNKTKQAQNSQSDQEEQDDKPFHTYTPKSHEKLLRRFSQAVDQKSEVKTLQQENDCLKRELSGYEKKLKKLQRRLKKIESKQNENVHTSIPSSEPMIDSQKERFPEMELANADLDNDANFSQSWQLLSHHFSEVIRRHNQALAEKDRIIKELQEKQNNIEISTNFTNPPALTSTPKNTDNPTDKPKNTSRQNAGVVSRNQNYNLNQGSLDSKKLKSNKSKNMIQGDIRNKEENKIAYELISKDQCVESGENLREHFNEVIRRHTVELEEKDGQIRELQEALNCFQSGRTSARTVCGSQKQICPADLYTKSSAFRREKSGLDVPKKQGTSSESSDDDLLTTTSSKLVTTHTSSDEDDEEYIDKEKTGSTDTFVALERCQRYEAITNLEKLKQTFMKRLDCEEKLDKLYWQTELRRYQIYKEETGDHSDPESSFNKDFEAFKGTRFELLEALNDLKQSGDNTDSHSYNQNSSQDTDNKRCLKVEEKIVFTALQTKYDN